MQVDYIYGESEEDKLQGFVGQGVDREDAELEENEQ